MPIQNIYELFILDWQDFVGEAYRNLLNREPDEQGMAYYLGRLAAGYGKTSVIRDLAESDEYRPVGDIGGLRQLLRNEKLINHWLLGVFRRSQERERLAREAISELRRFRQQTVVELEQKIAAMNSVLNLLPQQLDVLVERLAVMQTSFPSSQTPSVQVISADDVRMSFRVILGREPASDEVITNYRSFPSIKLLCEHLMECDEYKSHTSALNEYARSIFHRMQKRRSQEIG